ncbi:MAG: sigma-70 family RNA polymerase sigma factor [Chitinophagaceae bacterium]|nr:sigma-70 family RNA polymerase sigma factor [Chitinophagaceae bacterium]
MHQIERPADQIEQWYTSFYPILLKMGKVFRLPEEEIKDGIHQFFLELLEKGVQNDAIVNPRAYLVTAFHRKLIDRCRLLIRKGNESGNIMMDQAAVTPSIQEILIQLQTSSERIDKMREVFQRLPPRCKSVLSLKFYKGMSTEQIALYTGLSKRSVYNNLFEGIKLLRKECR